MPLLVYAALERDFDAALWAGLLLIGLAVLALAAFRWLTRAFNGEGDDIDPLAG